MKRFIKTVVIVGLCSVGVIALTHAVLGKQRTKDAAKALQKMAQGEVDELIRKQNDMKEELAKLRETYPKQIAVLKSQAREVERQLATLDTEAGRAADIVRLCEEDICYLEDQRDTVAAGVGTERVIEHRGSRYSAAEADKLVARIGQTRELYSTRLQDIEAERAVLGAEKEQLGVELAAIEAEQAEFEAEYQSLLREIERLKRNEEMLELAQTRAGCTSREHGEAMNTLTQVKGAVERARIEQEERLKASRVAPKDLDYETRAKLLELQRKQQAREAAQAPAAAPAEKEGAFSVK